MFCKSCSKDISHKHNGAVYCDRDCMKIDYTNNPTEKLLTQYKISESGCWEWFGNLCLNGYPRITFKKKTLKMHRYSWEYYNKRKIPKGKFICHTCDNTKCINPDHLYAGDPIDNVRDMMERNRNVVCRGTDTGSAKVNEDDVIAILKDERSASEICKDYPISRKQVKNIKDRKAWKHIKIKHYGL